MLRSKTFYARRANISLVLLWVGAIILLIVMLYNWRAKTDSSDSPNALLNPRGIFADELLLSSQDLQLGESVSLINISLNRDASDKNAENDMEELDNTLPERKLVYSKMLKNKIKKIAATPANNGFTIKPLPQ